jgi:hypothetical protein
MNRQTLVLSMVCSLPISFTTHAATLRTVALTGQQAPGTPEAVTFNSFGYASSGSFSFGPVINDAGQVAFGAQLTGSGAGIWSEGSGNLALVARRGSQAPGAPDGATFGTFGHLNAPFLLFNNAGQTAFYAFGTGIGHSVWSEGSGNLAMVVRYGDPAPGAPDGALFGSLTLPSPTLNNAGQTAFRARWSTGTVSGSGIWSDRSGSLAGIAVTGNPAPGLPSGINFSSENMSMPALNDAGQTAFWAGAGGSSIWSEGSGSLALVARTNDPAPGMTDGSRFGAFNTPVMNNAGHVAFEASAGGDSIWSNASGSLRLIAKQGDPAPGGGTFGEMRYWSPVLNNAGHVVFLAILTQTRGIWLERDGNVELVARLGDHAPGTPEGVTFASFGHSISSSSMPFFNDADQIAFSAGLSDGGGGIWASDTSGVLQLIARSGDLLEVAPGNFRTISGLTLDHDWDGVFLPRPRTSTALNNLGQLVFRASFTDGTSGIFVSNTVAVPEPSTLLLGALAGITFLWRRQGSIFASIFVAAIGIGFADSTFADTFGSGANTFDIEFVTIGNPGNAADTDDGDYYQSGVQHFGFVDTAFRIGKFEINRDMVTKANSVGGLGITLLDMTFFDAGGNGPDRPATGVSWNEAARFVNWLNTSRGFHDAYKFSTQPGQIGYDANQDISLWVAGDAGFNAANPLRNSLAHYFLPNADEWYKAAYYDPNANNGAGGYWDLPTGSDSYPTPVASGTLPGTAVYAQASPTNTGHPADITQAGGLSPYGTMAMGGNVYEWEESIYYVMIHSPTYVRGVRGGSWGSYAYPLTSKYRDDQNRSDQTSPIGFRVASISDLPGDFNHDGTVDAADYIVWRKGIGVAPTQDNYNLWRANFGQTYFTGTGASTDANATVPEPAAVVMLMFAAASWCLRRRRTA